MNFFSFLNLFSEIFKNFFFESSIIFFSSSFFFFHSLYFVHLGKFFDSLFVSLSLCLSRSLERSIKLDLLTISTGVKKGTQLRHTRYLINWEETEELPQKYFCVIVAKLPDYSIRRVRTGQLQRSPAIFLILTNFHISNSSSSDKCPD